MSYYLGLARATYVNPPTRPGKVTVGPGLGLAIVVCLRVWPRPVFEAAMAAAAGVF